MKKSFLNIFSSKNTKISAETGGVSIIRRGSMLWVKTTAQEYLQIICPILQMKNQPILPSSKLDPSIQATYFAVLILFSKSLMFIVSLETFSSFEESVENYHNTGLFSIKGSFVFQSLSLSISHGTIFHFTGWISDNNKTFVKVHIPIAFQLCHDQGTLEFPFYFDGGGEG